MPQDAHPLDHLTAGLIDVYATQTRRLEAIVRAGIAQGLTEGQPGAASLAYRQRALAQAKDQLAALTDITHRGVKPIIGSAYGAALTVTDRHLAATGQATTGMIGTFGRLDVRAVETAAAQLDGALTEAARQVGERIDDVFTAAAAIADGGPLPKTPFLGRRFNDELRRFTLEAVAGGTVALDTRRQVSEQLAQRLIREGVTTATAGIIDRGGRRWSLDHYAAMAARTTTREIASEATINRMVEHGADLVAISSHPHAADECSPYDGQTFSISGNHPTYPKLDRRPPFHPNCRHVVTPAGANLDEFEAALGSATGQQFSSTPKVVQSSAPEPVTPAAPALRDSFQLPAAGNLRGDKVLDASTTALDAIDGLHGFDRGDLILGGLDEKLPIRPDPNLRFQAAYRYFTEPNALGMTGKEIVVKDTRNIDPDDMAYTIVHEIGHFLDHRVSGGDHTLGTEIGDPDVRRVMQAVKNTEGKKRLERIADGTEEATITYTNGNRVTQILPASVRRKVRNYLLSDAELWARAYAQWVMTRSGSAALRRGHKLHGEVSLGKAEQWDDDDFAEVAAEFDDFMRRKGLAR